MHKRHISLARQKCEKAELYWHLSSPKHRNSSSLSILLVAGQGQAGVFANRSVILGKNVSSHSKKHQWNIPELLTNSTNKRNPIWTEREQNPLLKTGSSAVDLCSINKNTSALWSMKSLSKKEKIIIVQKNRACSWVPAKSETRKLFLLGGVCSVGQGGASSAWRGGAGLCGAERGPYWLRSVPLDKLDDCILGTSVSPEQSNARNVSLPAQTREFQCTVAEGQNPRLTNDM